ncbi:MAG: SH3 domain-containing protein [Clostridiales bacterium]|nr:SH3 domain-containing protein [Clostridiales bacterium]
MSKKIKVAGLMLAGSILVIGSERIVQAENLSVNAAGDYQLFAGASEVLMNILAESDLLAHGEDRMKLTDEKEAELELHEVPEVASEYADIAIATVLNYVNLRAEPTTESEVLGKLYANSAATVLETVTDEAGEEWHRINSGSVENGYVKAEYVVVGEEELIRQVSTRYAAVRTTTLFVRKEPGTDSSVLTMLPDGDDVVVLEEREDGWLKVSTEEGDGYVSGEYVELWTDYIEAESKAEEEARLAREEEERRAAAAAAEAARKAQEEEARRAREAAEAEAARKAAQSNSSSSKQSSSGSSSSSQSSAGGSSGSNSSGGNKTEGAKPSVSNGQAVVNYASQFVGNPYVYGGSSLTNGADCSGFVMSVYAAFGISLPHSSSALRSVGYGVTMDQIQPGDIVCYSGHVGIYAGNNTLLHASSPKTGIKYTSPITYREILAIRRIF